jgi:cell surface protein SprA
MRNVKPKKYLGQHFLNDENIARKIVNSLSLSGYSNVMEIGPGTGVLTKYLLDLKLDLNIRNNKTVIRKVIEDVEQITMGQQIISIKFSADYVLNQRLNIKAFYDKIITNPFISTTFPGSITNAGFSLRFTLAG